MSANPPTSQSYMLLTKAIRREATYGAGYADADYIDKIIGIEPGFFNIIPTYRDDSRELNGWAGPTEHDIESWSGEKDYKFYLSPQVYQYFLGLQLSNVTSSGSSDPWTHVNKFPAICTLSPYSAAFMETPDCLGATADFMQYKGAMVEETDVEINGQASLTGSVKLVTDGSETNKPLVTIPANPYTAKKLTGQSVTFKCGPLGTENFTPDFRSAKINIKSGLTRRPGVSAGPYAQGFNFGDNAPAPTVSFVILGDKSHVMWGYFKAKTLLKLDILVDPGVTPARSIRWQMDRCIVKARVVPAGSESHLQVDVMPQWNTVDGGPMTITTKSGTAAYLLAA